MELEKMLEKVKNADAESADRILEAVFARRRELFPDWDMIYLALPKNDPKERKRILVQALDILMREKPCGRPGIAPAE